MNILFLKLLNTSISAGWLVLAVLVLRLCLKKAPKWVSVLLWGIVAIRLILPFSIESVLSLIPSVQTVPMDIELSTAPAVDTGVTVLNNAVNPILAQSVPSPGASINPMQVIIAVCANVWLLGVAVMALYTAISYLRLCRRVRTAVRLQGNIYQSEQVDSPFVLGLLFPRIYLPFSMDAQALSHVVAHETAHIRRKDHWWKPLGFLLLTLHWFNPLMWLAYILLCRDIELACDEKVIKELGCDQRADYTQALLSCSVSRKSIAACPLAFGEVGVKERVKSVMKYKKPAFWIIVAAIAICAVVAVCFLTDPVQDDPNEPHSGEVTQRIDEALEKKIRKAMYLPDSQVLTYAGEYSQEPYTLLWVCYEVDGVEHYEAVACEENFAGELKFKDTCHVTTYTAGIFHTAWMGEDIYLVNNPNCKQIINRSGDFRQEVPIEEDDYPYVYRALPMESPWMLTFADANRNDLYQPDTPIVEFDFLAEVLEIHDDYYTVKPGDGWPDVKVGFVEVPMESIGASPKPQVGDTLIISCRWDTLWEALEDHPARLAYVSRIRVVDVPEFTLPRMILVNGKLYTDTEIEGITKNHSKIKTVYVSSAVRQNQRPTTDNQANFETPDPCYYHAGSIEGTIEVNIDGSWWIFANEAVWSYITASGGELPKPIPVLNLPAGSVTLSAKELETVDGWFAWDGDMFNYPITNSFLAYYYRTPDELSMFELFGPGCGDNQAGQISNAERTALSEKNPHFSEGYEVNKIKRSSMDNILRQNTGFGLEDRVWLDLEAFTYLEEYDAYYVIYGGTNWWYYNVVEGYRCPDGSLILVCEKPSQWEESTFSVLTLRPAETGEGFHGYWFVSNLYYDK